MIKEGTVLQVIETKAQKVRDGRTGQSLGNIHCKNEADNILLQFQSESPDHVKEDEIFQVLGDNKDSQLNRMIVKLEEKWKVL